MFNKALAAGSFKSIGEFRMGWIACRLGKDSLILSNSWLISWRLGVVNSAECKMSGTKSSLSAADLFSVNGLVAVVTGGATGTFAHI